MDVAFRSGVASGPKRLTSRQQGFGEYGQVRARYDPFNRTRRSLYGLWPEWAWVGWRYPGGALRLDTGGVRGRVTVRSPTISDVTPGFGSIGGRRWISFLGGYVALAARILSICVLCTLPAGAGFVLCKIGLEP